MVCVCVCVCADMYDGLCLLQKKKDLGRRKDMLFSWYRQFSYTYVWA